MPKNSLRVWPGTPYPLGATWDGVGVNFALFSEHATRVELCLFDSPGRGSRVAHDPAARTDRHGLARLPARRRIPASSTAIAFTDPYAPHAGHRFNPHKLVMDPYAKVVGPCRSVARVAVRLPLRSGRHDVRRPRQRAVRAARGRRRRRVHVGRRSAAAHAVAQDADLRAARQGLHAAEPARPGSAARHLPRPRRRKPAIRHLTSLGVTAVELMPVHHHEDEWHLDQARPDELLGLQHAVVLRARRPLRRVVVAAWTPSASSR